MLYYCIQINR